MGLPIEKTKGKKQKAIPVKIVSEVNSPSAEQDRKWRAQDDIRTMQNAEAIRKDKERMKAMKEVAKEQMRDLKKIC